MKCNRSDCPLNYCLEIVGDRWTLLILRDLILLKKKTFGEIRSSPEKIATNILTSRLNLLEKEGIIHKERNPKDKKVYYYRLTEKGTGLLPLLLEMALWGATYAPVKSASTKIIKRIKNDREGLMKEILTSLRAGRIRTT